LIGSNARAAALIIQGSTCVYSKKVRRRAAAVGCRLRANRFARPAGLCARQVEYLHTLLYQTLDILSTEAQRCSSYPLPISVLGYRPKPLLTVNAGGRIGSKRRRQALAAGAVSDAADGFGEMADEENVVFLSLDDALPGTTASVTAVLCDVSRY
jgi:hypothetical protein